MRSLARFAPGLAALRQYKPADAPADIKAGVSVAAVALPVGIAYAELAGLPAETGIYASILPLIAYAIFGSSRQLIVGPDAATCAVIAAAAAPLAVGNPEAYASIVGALALVTGLICITASFFRLGALANFLSRPILVGFLNGVALSIILGQAGKILGFEINEDGILPRLWEIGSRLGETHVATLLTAIATLFAILVASRFASFLPGPLVGMVLASAAVPLFGLSEAGVKTLGPVAAGLPSVSFPVFDLGLLPQIIAMSAGLALVSFSSLMLTARSFAAKNGYEVDSDQDFAALGVANIASSLSQGFAISGADSRTAMSDSVGGRTHAVGLVTAALMAFVLLFLTAPLQYIPLAALGMVLVLAGWSLIDVGALRFIYRLDREEALLSILATLGVVAVGAVNAILFVAVLSLLRFIKLLSSPKIEILGKVEGFPGLHSLERHEGGQSFPGLLLFRFNAPITFFNSPYLKRELMKAVDEAEPAVRHVVLDMLPITSVDATGLLTLSELLTALEARNISLNAAGRQTEWRHWAESREFGHLRIGSFPTLRQAVRELSGG